MINDIFDDSTNNLLTWSANLDDMEFRINAVFGNNPNKQEVLYIGPNMSCDFDLQKAERPIMIMSYSKKHQTQEWEKGAVYIVK